MKSAIFSLAFLAMLFPFSAAEGQKSLEQQAEALLDKALQPGSPETKLNFAKQAEALYIKAVAEMKNEADKAKTDKDRHEAHFRMGVLLMGKRTYIALGKDAENTKFALAVAEALKTFTDILTVSEKGKVKDQALAYRCRAWLYKCGKEGNDSSIEKENLDKVMSAKTKDAEEAQSLIRFWRLGFTANPKGGRLERVRAIQKDAEAWLKEYPAYRKTSTGYAVQFEQAVAVFEETKYFTQRKKDLDKSIADTEETIKLAKTKTPGKIYRGDPGQGRKQKVPG